MKEAIQRAIVLAPHPDDGEFGCGASLRKLSDAGVEIYYVAFSPCIKSLPAGSATDRLFKELEKAAAHLGIKAGNITTFDYEVRCFPAARQEILEDLVKLRKELKPDLVLMPNSDDLHQDHHTVYQEGLRAFKHSRLLGYELPWNNLHFRSDFHIKVEKEHLEAKAAAVQEYESQRFRSYSDIEFLSGVARMRGIQINSEYAEAFEGIRWFI